MTVESTREATSAHEATAATRRDFLYIATGAAAAVGTLAALFPMVDQMEPDASTLAAGGPVEFDLSKLQPGQHAVVRWRSRPIFIVNRPAAALKTLQDPKLLARLSDPGSSAPQQPPYADNWHRSIKPEYGVLVGICTHLGCIPMFYPDPEQQRSRRPTGWAAISVRVTARNTIWPAASSAACRRPTTCRCRPIDSSATPPSGSARTRPTSSGTFHRSRRFERALSHQPFRLSWREAHTLVASRTTREMSARTIEVVCIPLQEHATAR